MKGLKPFLSLLVGCLACAILSGCAGSVPQNGPGALTIAQFALSEGVPGLAYRQLLIASGGKTPYTWTISQGSLPPGLSLASDGIISGTPTTTGSYDFTVKVVDSQTPTAAVDTTPLSIMINPPLSLVTTPLASGIVGANYSATLSASNGVAPYTYSVAFGNLPPCSPTPPCSPNLTLTTGTQPVGGGANPATIGGLVPLSNGQFSAESPTQAGVFNFTIQATDSLGEVATAIYSITVTGPLQGNYAITFNGFSHGLPFYLAGEINAASGQNINGTITGPITGVIDQNGPNGVSTAVPLTTGSSYSLPVGSNLGTITLETSTLGRYVYSIALSTISDSALILVNANMYGSGLVKRQPPVLALPDNGASYGFGLFGNDSAGNRYAAAGTFSINPSFVVTGGEEDTNDNGTISSGAIPITGGSLVPDASNPGRGVASLTTASGTATYAYYIASLTELVAVRIDTGPMTIADIQQQTSAGITGSLTLCKAGSNCQSVVELDGYSSSGGTSVPIAATGVVAYDGSGNIAGPRGLPGYVTDQSIGGTYAPISYETGSYTTDSLGRVTVDLQGATSQPVWYLVGTGQAFVVGTDSTVMSGTLQPQTIPTSGSFGEVNFLGSYLGGTITPTLASITNEIDAAFTPPPGGIFDQLYETNGPGAGRPITTPANFIGGYIIDPTFGPPYGRFAVCAQNASQYCTGSTQFTYDPSSPPVYIFYVIGSGSAGVTGGKTGLSELNFGLVQPDQTTIVDPNPRVSVFGR